ncbi:MAG: molybdate ABC transporter permease subunit [Anaerolineales bacterium]|nr:molybdate ABC transporter permease subunit [Anaerolineales bacterium]
MADNAVQSKSSAPDAAELRRRGVGRAGLLSLPLLLFLVIPLGALLLRAAPADVGATLLEPEVRQAITLSARTTLVTTALAVIGGTPVAYLLARRRFPGWRLVDTLVELPTVLPPAVAGVALLMAFGRRGLLGQWLAAAGLGVSFTTTAVVMAQLFIAAPLFVRAATLGFAAITSELEQAAEIDGASPWQRFRYVTLPLAYPALLSGAVVAWARALGEFGATIIFAGNFPGRTQTMPLAIYIGFELDLDAALVLSVLMIAAAFATLALVKWGLHRDHAQ